MNAKLRCLALVLGLVGLLAVPPEVRSSAWNKASGHTSTAHDPAGIRLADGTSLLATGAPTPAAQTAPQSATPDIKINKPLFYFGHVLEGTEVVHDFLVENRGSGDLAIDQVKTG